MARSNSEAPLATTVHKKHQSSPLMRGSGPRRAPTVFVFNPFAEGYIAHGQAFTPVTHQKRLAEDLANLPQFLCQPGDIVLLPKPLSANFLNTLQQAGFSFPEFVVLREGRINSGDAFRDRNIDSLRPWAWGPDSVTLFNPLFALLPNQPRTADQYFNDQISQFCSKAWSVSFLRKVLARWNELRSAAAAAKPWLCSEQEAGVAVDTIEHALDAIAAIRSRGHHRVVIKEAYGVAGHNSIRLWEPELLPKQQKWMAKALQNGRQLVVEPWLERKLDFSVQLEMCPGGLKLCGYTGLVNDLKGQFLANWAEADHTMRMPANVASFFGATPEISEYLQRLYQEIFSLLDVELKRAGFLGPVSIDTFIYRTPQGDFRLKPVVEINPRYTMGRLTIELMKHACPGTYGLFRLVSQTQARRAGFADLESYARCLAEHLPVRLDDECTIHQGALCLNDPAQAQVCLATFEVTPTIKIPHSNTI